MTWARRPSSCALRTLVPCAVVRFVRPNDGDTHTSTPAHQNTSTPTHQHGNTATPTPPPPPPPPRYNLQASLADPKYQDYFARLLIDFVSTTGAGGFAWDYGINGDWRQPSTYAEWRGWMRVLKQLREAHPDVVMDHRQTAHRWGPWYQLAGSYTEPISGDENPESYGAGGNGAARGEER